MTIPWADLSVIGWPGLVTLFVILVLTGRLVPGKERDHWRNAFFQEQEMRRDMEVTGRLQKKVFDSLPSHDGEG